MYDKESGTAIGKERCPACASIGRDRSGDNLAIYDDGGKYCFSCGYYENGIDPRLARHLLA